MGDLLFHQAADQLAFIDNRYCVEAALGEFGNHLRALVVRFDAKQAAVHQVADRLPDIPFLQELLTDRLPRSFLPATTNTAGNVITVQLGDKVFARLMDAEMFLQRNKIGTHVLGDRIAVEARGRLMGGAELNGRHD